MNETRVWLRMIREARILTATATTAAEQECIVLCRIIAARIKTVQARMKRN